MESSTKERILEVALNLFSQSGFYGTSMSDIAGELGLTKAALYRHFSGKEKIMDAILDIREEYYEKNFGSLTHLPKIPESVEALRDLSLNQIKFTMHDPDIKKCRKLFVIEQFRNERMAELATRHFLTGLESMYSLIFEKMMEKGILKQSEPGFMAFEYVTPITMMIQLCDRQPEKEDEALERIRQHIDNFLKIYAV